MSSLMLINPARRPKKRRKARSAAQKAATRRMVAARRASNPAPARRRRRRSSVRHHNPIGLHRVISRHRRHARRRNPIGGLGNIGTMVVNGLKGAGGAIVVNAITSFLPAAITTGKVQYATRAGLAILLGTVGRKALGNNARVMAEGAMVVTMHDLINSFAGSMLPGSQMHGMGAYLSEAQVHTIPNASGSPIDTELHGMGEYLNR